MTLARRQLNAGQKAMMALEYERHYAEAVKAEEKARKGKPAPWESDISKATPVDLPESRHERESREKAAKAVGTSGASVQRAKTITRDAPDLASDVRAGEVPPGLEVDPVGPRWVRVRAQSPRCPCQLR